ncbi:hypothetical protein ACTVD7_006441 [Pseudomonas aeruginosa]|jgi:hypothetical protein|uniref:Uncharacterized protein n=3 Tax=Pseudomonas TaxID=286 RepID=A0A2K4XI84_PSEAI|nr:MULTISPECIES: hypothetical protein [Pseudomonas]EIU1491978.1 hypothetical protein [Pseudomonas aeruginosa]EIU2790034.1 hypothetical protein [Pseudomonas aeruginosa]EIU3314217.1 hypothetical protein [Pseudomonas aeruginosa]EIU3359868.1 hypothetical protein [Pseudomonas aeruginosa]EIU3488628.1 hypothetical protein [Pseudomonas aeruginosa]
MQQISITLPSELKSSGAVPALECPVQPMDHVIFTPHDKSMLKPTIRGRVMNTLRTSAGNWRCAIVLQGEPFPNGNSVNVYSHEGCFDVVEGHFNG